MRIMIIEYKAAQGNQPMRNKMFGVNPLGERWEATEQIIPCDRIGGTCFACFLRGIQDRVRAMTRRSMCKC